MTALEHLAFYGALRGFAPADAARSASRAASRAGLRGAAALRTIAANLSGGQRRKLSVAVALVGDPAVVLLDEPSTGMDPESRRGVWRALASAAAEGRAMVLTTHSTEEADALCRRIAIARKGAFRCLGTAQRLKAAHGEGYALVIRVSEEGDDAARTARRDGTRAFVAREMPGAREETLEETPEETTFLTTSPNLWFRLAAGASVARAFAAMEARDETLGIVEYQLGQTTLEEVFLRVAEEEETEEEETEEEETARARENETLSESETVYSSPDSRVVSFSARLLRRSRGAFRRQRRLLFLLGHLFSKSASTPGPVDLATGAAGASSPPLPPSNRGRDRGGVSPGLKVSGRRTAVPAPPPAQPSMGPSQSMPSLMTPPTGARFTLSPSLSSAPTVATTTVHLRGRSGEGGLGMRVDARVSGRGRGRVRVGGECGGYRVGRGRAAGTRSRGVPHGSGSDVSGVGHNLDGLVRAHVDAQLLQLILLRHLLALEHEPGKISRQIVSHPTQSTPPRAAREDLLGRRRTARRTKQ